MYSIIENCTVTRTTSSVLYPYIDSDASDWYEKYGGFHTGIDIQCKSVHSVCQGVVLLVGTDFDSGLYEITIQYDAHRGFRYCNLSSVRVEAGDTIKNGQWIADAEDFVHFEYIDTTSGDPEWVCHIGEQDYYKHDPYPYADGSITLPDDTSLDTYIVPEYEVFPEVDWTSDMDSEFGDNRVDDEPAGIWGGVYNP